MIQKILVALDDGETCQRVFDDAIELALATQAMLNLVSVLTLESHESFQASPPYSDAEWKAYARRYQEAQTANFKLLKDFAEAAKATNIEADFTQTTGSPGPAICKLAQAWNADLILVGSHGRRGLSEMLLGSVSNYVVHHASCSVLVVHGSTVEKRSRSL